MTRDGEWGRGERADPGMGGSRKHLSLFPIVPTWPQPCIISEGWGYPPHIKCVWKREKSVLWLLKSKKEEQPEPWERRSQGMRRKTVKFLVGKVANASVHKNSWMWPGKQCHMWPGEGLPYTSNWPVPGSGTEPTGEPSRSLLVTARRRCSPTFQSLNVRSGSRTCSSYYSD